MDNTHPHRTQTKNPKPIPVRGGIKFPGSDKIDAVFPALVDKAIEMALDGNEKLLIWLMEKRSKASIIYKSVTSFKSIEELDQEAENVVTKVFNGEIDIDAAEIVMKLLAQKKQMIIDAVIEPKMRELERRQEIHGLMK